AQHSAGGSHGLRRGIGARSHVGRCAGGRRGGDGWARDQGLDGGQVDDAREARQEGGGQEAGGEEAYAQEEARRQEEGGAQGRQEEGQERCLIVSVPWSARW